MGDLLLLADLACAGKQHVRGGRGRGVDALLERDRVGARGHRTTARPHHGLGEHGGRGGAVTGHVVGLGRYFLGELCAQVLVAVFELHLPRDGHAVVGDGGSAPLLVDDDVAPTRAQRHLHGVREVVHAALQRAPCLLVELQHLGCHELPLTT